MRWQVIKATLVPAPGALGAVAWQDQDRQRIGRRYLTHRGAAKKAARLWLASPTESFRVPYTVFRAERIRSS